MDDAGKIAQAEPTLRRDGEFGDSLARPFRDNCCTKYGAIGLVHDFQETVSAFFADGAVVLFERAVGDVHRASKFLAGFGFR